jgi:hypothetical protein
MWVLNIATGSGMFDRSGRVIGTDYLEFYAAGRAVSRGSSASLYDDAYMQALEQQIAGPELGRYYAFITPPFFAWLYAPLSAMPYVFSFAVWTVSGLGMLWLSLSVLAPGRPTRQFWWSLTFFPVFAAVSYGQNSLLTLAILSMTFGLWSRGWAGAAGLVASLVAFKPQLLIGVALLWTARFRQDWRALVALCCGVLGIASVSLLSLPEASLAYVRFARSVLPGLPHWLNFPLWNLHTARGFWWLLMPAYTRLADALWCMTVLALIVAFVRFIRAFGNRFTLLFSAAIVFTVIATPHALIYDWAVLLIPAVLLRRDESAIHREWIAVCAIVWIAALVSGPLTLLQQRYLPFAIQVSVPLVLVASALTVGMLRKTTVPSGVTKSAEGALAFQ